MDKQEEQTFFLSPLSFFYVGTQCVKLPKGIKFLDEKQLTRYLIPNTTLLSGDNPFAIFAMGWAPEGLSFYVKVERSAALRCFFPAISRGDSVELFIDTRDVKSSGHNTRFCHHFFFLPEAVEGYQAGELTRFRTEDSHEFCLAENLETNVDYTSNGYCIKIFIPSQCLHGYDPEMFARCGFSYRINRYGAEPLNFSASSKDFSIEEQPSLWSSMSFLP